MTRGLHPETRPQRASEGGVWRTPGEGPAVETREPPMRDVARGLAGTFVALLVALALVAGLVRLIEGGRLALPASIAENRFDSAGPPLLAAPRKAVEMSERLHRLPEPAVDRAMRDVAQSGWGESEPRPSRAETAMDRAEAEQ